MSNELRSIKRNMARRAGFRHFWVMVKNVRRGFAAWWKSRRLAVMLKIADIQEAYARRAKA